MKYGLLIGTLITILIGILITFYSLKATLNTNNQNNSEKEINNTSEGTPIEQTNKAKATAELKSVETYLEIYRTQNQKYPISSSYSSMTSIVEKTKITASLPDSPNQDYKYKYCSSDGLNFLLEAKNKRETITSFGTAKCLSGE